MNHYDAILIRQRHAQRQPVGAAELAEANEYIERTRNLDPAPRPWPSATPAPRFISNIAPTYDTLCECGSRYGMHRTADFACPNQQWRCGNGQPQWLVRKWKRA